MNIKKLMKLVLALVVAISLIACSGGANAGNEEKNEVEKTEETTTVVSPALNLEGFPIVNEPVTLTVMIAGDPSVPVNYDEKLYYKNLEKKTGVHIEWEVVLRDEWEQKKNLMYTSGQYPDIIINGLDGAAVVDEEKYGVEQGILVPVENLMAEHMPNVTALMDSRPEWKPLIQATDGHVYGIPSSWEIGYNTAGHIFLNQKWLQQLELEVPETLEEFNKVLLAFKESDMAGDGETIPLDTVFFNDTNGLNNLFGLFGRVDTGTNDKSLHLVVEDDKVVFTADKEEYKEAAKWFNFLYTNGLLDPEFFTQDTNTYNAKIKSGNVGAFLDWRLSSMAYTFEGMEEDYICIPPLKNGNVETKWQKTISGINVARVFVTSNCKDKEVAARWIDAQADPLEGLQGRFGVEGIALVKNAEGKLEQDIVKEDGTNMSNEEINKEIPGPSGYYFLTRENINENFVLAAPLVEKYKYVDMYQPYLEETSNQMISYLRINQEERDKVSRTTTEIHNFVKETLVRWITKGGIDEEWDAYVSQLNGMGVQDITNIYQKAYDDLGTVK